MNEFKINLVRAWREGGVGFKLAILIMLVSGFITVTRVNPVDPLPNYIGFLIYISSATYIVREIYLDED